MPAAPLVRPLLPTHLCFISSRCFTARSYWNALKIVLLARLLGLSSIRSAVIWSFWPVSIIISEKLFDKGFLRLLPVFTYRIKNYQLLYVHNCEGFFLETFDKNFLVKNLLKNLGFFLEFHFVPNLNFHRMFFVNIYLLILVVLFVVPLFSQIHFQSWIRVLFGKLSFESHFKCEYFKKSWDSFPWITLLRFLSSKTNKKG